MRLRILYQIRIRIWTNDNPLVHKTTEPQTCASANGSSWREVYTKGKDWSEDFRRTIWYRGTIDCMVLGKHSSLYFTKKIIEATNNNFAWERVMLFQRHSIHNESATLKKGWMASNDMSITTIIPYGPCDRYPGIPHSKNQECRVNWNFGSRFCMPILDVGHQLIFGPMSQLTICQGHGYLEIRNQGNTLKTEPSPKDMQSKVQLSHHLCLEHLRFKKKCLFDKNNGECTTLQQKNPCGCFRKKWVSPQIIYFNRVFHYKPSVLGCFPIFWKHPCWHCPPPTWLRLWTAVPPTVLWPFTWQLAPQRWRGVTVHPVVWMVSCILEPSC